MKEIELFAPATIANVSCGYDVMGCCLDSIGDIMIIRKKEGKGIVISKISGGDLPFEPEKNVAGAAIMAMLADYGKDLDHGFDIEIHKKIKPGSGIGSSAASAAGAVYGANELMGRPYTNHELVKFAAEGERVACGAPIADNVAPALLGGFTLVQSTDPIKIVELPGFEELYATIIHPQIEIKTSLSRDILPKKVALEKAVKQWANVGTFVHALHTKDYDLFAESLTDYIVEPHRSKLIPKFDEVKKKTIETGALGCGISGSGPSIFTFSKDIETANNVRDIIKDVYDKTTIPYHLYTSKINKKGIKILNRK